MQSNRYYMVVKINKALQQQRQEKIGSIFLPQDYIYSKYNLQYGELMLIGEDAGKNYPMANIGDTVIFNHAVEDNPAVRLVYTEPNKDEWRTVEAGHDMEIYGFVKPDGTWVAAPSWIFLEEKVKVLRQQAFESLFIKYDEEAEIWDDTEKIMDKIKTITADMESLKETFEGMEDPVKFDDVYKGYESLNRDREALSKFMNKKKLCRANVVHANEETAEYFGIKRGTELIVPFEILYPLQVLGSNFKLIHKDYVVGYFN